MQIHLTKYKSAKAGSCWHQKCVSLWTYILMQSSDPRFIKLQLLGSHDNLMNCEDESIHCDLQYFMPKSFIAQNGIFYTVASPKLYRPRRGDARFCSQECVWTHPVILQQIEHGLCHFFPFFPSAAHLVHIHNTVIYHRYREHVRRLYFHFPPVLRSSSSWWVICNVAGIWNDFFRSSGRQECPVVAFNCHLEAHRSRRDFLWGSLHLQQFIDE